MKECMKDFVDYLCEPILGTAGMIAVLMYFSARGDAFDLIPFIAVLLVILAEKVWRSDD